MSRLTILHAGCVLLLLLATAVTAESTIGEYQTRGQFLESTLGSEQPPSGTLWIDDETRPLVTGILGRAPEMLRIRYWYDETQTAWIFDEIGKEKPITFGVLVERGQIRILRVLAFRESRGWEIRYPFFTRQFIDASLDNSGEIDRRIDSISGATLSVNASKKVAQLALTLDDHVRRTNTSIAQSR